MLIANLIIGVTAPTTRLEKDMKRGSLAVKQFSIATAAAAIVVAQSFRFMLTAGTQFVNEMTRSLAIMGNVDSATKKEMEQAALRVAATTKFSAAEAAKGFFFLASAGLDAKKSIAALPQVAQFAQAGWFDLADATSLLANAQSALGLKSKDFATNMTNMARVADVLVKANTLADATVRQFSEALTTKLGSALRLTGKDIEEGAAILAVFADQGIKGAEAGTAADIVLRELRIKAARNAEAFEKLNVAVFNTSGEMRHISDIMEDFEKKMEGASTQQKTLTLLQLGFTAKSISYVQQLIGSSDALRTFETELDKAGGTTKEVADKMLTPMVVVWNKLAAAVTAAGTIIVKAGNLMASAFTAIDTIMRSNVSRVLAFSAAFVAFALIVPKIIGMIILLTKALKSLVIAKAQALALSGPKGWAVLALGAIAAATAVAVIESSFGDVTKELDKGQKAAETLAKNMDKIGKAGKGPIADTVGNVEALAEKMQKFATIIKDLTREADIFGLDRFEVIMRDASKAGAGDLILGQLRAATDRVKRLELGKEWAEQWNEKVATGRELALALATSTLAPAAVERGTAAAFSAAQAARNTNLKSLEQINKEQLAVLKTIADEAIKAGRRPEEALVPLAI